MVNRFWEIAWWSGYKHEKRSALDEYDKEDYEIMENALAYALEHGWEPTENAEREVKA